MSTTVLLGLTSFEKIGGQWIFGGASDFSNLLAPWASGSRSLMLRAVLIRKRRCEPKQIIHWILDNKFVEHPMLLSCFQGDSKTFEQKQLNSRGSRTPTNPEWGAGVYGSVQRYECAWSNIIRASDFPRSRKTRGIADLKRYPWNDVESRNFICNFIK